MKKLLSALLLTLPMLSHGAPGDVVSLGEDVGATFRLNSSSLTIEPDLAPIRDNEVDLGSATNRFRRIYVVEVIESSNTLAPGSTQYIQNRNTLQPGATSYAEFTQTKNLSVYGTPNIAPGATNYIANQSTLQSGANSYVERSSATVMNASTYTATDQFLGVNSNISAPTYSFKEEPTLGFYRAGTNNMDFVTGGNLRVRFSPNGLGARDGSIQAPGIHFFDEPSMGLRRVSTGIIWLMANGVVLATGTASSQLMEFYSIQTGTSTSVGPACASGYTRVGLSHCYDTDSVKAVDITSVPANTVSDFTTTNLAALNSTNAKFAILRVKCQTSQDATDGVNDVSLFMRKGGGSGSKDNSTSVCDTRGRIGSAAGEAYYFDTNEVTIALDANKDFDYACETTETGNDVACYISLVGYIE